MDNVYENNVYSLRKAMWHNKGTVGTGEESAMQVYSRMKPVDFVQRPFSIMLNGKVIESKNIAIIRIENGHEKQIGSTKNRYKLIQPIEYIKLFDETVAKPVETLGFLGSNGQRMFLTWDLPAIDVHGDKLEMYGFLATGFDGLFSAKLYTTSVRVVCQNTWNAAVSDSETGEVFSNKHTEVNHVRNLGLWMSYITKNAENNVAMLQNLFMKFEEKPLGLDEAYGFFARVYPYPDEVSKNQPDILVKEDEDKAVKDTETANQRRDLAMSLFEGAGVQITPTLWGGFNVVTEMENHKIPSKKETDFSILMGSRQNTMTTAFNVAKEMVAVR